MVEPDARHAGAFRIRILPRRGQAAGALAAGEVTGPADAAAAADFAADRVGAGERLLAVARLVARAPLRHVGEAHRGVAMGRGVAVRVAGARAAAERGLVRRLIRRSRAGDRRIKAASLAHQPRASRIVRHRIGGALAGDADAVQSASLAGGRIAAGSGLGEGAAVQGGGAADPRDAAVAVVAVPAGAVAVGGAGAAVQLVRHADAGRAELVAVAEGNAGAGRMHVVIEDLAGGRI